VTSWIYLWLTQCFLRWAAVYGIAAHIVHVGIIDSLSIHYWHFYQSAAARKVGQPAAVQTFGSVWAFSFSTPVGAALRRAKAIDISKALVRHPVSIFVPAGRLIGVLCVVPLPSRDAATVRRGDLRSDGKQGAMNPPLARHADLCGWPRGRAWPHFESFVCDDTSIACRGMHHYARRLWLDVCFLK